MGSDQTFKDRRDRAARVFVIGTLTICGAIFAFIGWWLVRQTEFSPRHELAREEYRALHVGLTPGMSRADVVAAFQSLAPKYLRFSPDDSDEWQVRTPMYFGATNWLMYLHFDGDMLIEVHSGSLDQYSVANGAPPDKKLAQ